KTSPTTRLPEPLARADAATSGRARAESRTSRWMRFMEPPIGGRVMGSLATARHVAPTVSFAHSARNRHASARDAGVRRAVRFTEMDALERAGQVSAAWEERVRADLPADLDIFDAHTHLGTDIDGMVGRYEELLGAMDRFGVS